MNHSNTTHCTEKVDYTIYLTDLSVEIKDHWLLARAVHWSPGLGAAGSARVGRVGWLQEGLLLLLFVCLVGWLFVCLFVCLFGFLFENVIISSVDLCPPLWRH